MTLSILLGREKRFKYVCYKKSVLIDSLHNGLETQYGTQLVRCYRAFKTIAD